MEIVSVDVVGCGCAGEAAMATDSDATDFDAGNEFDETSYLGQMVRSFMLSLRQDIVLHSGAKSWTRQIVYRLINIKNSLPIRYRLDEGLLQAWPGNNNRLFHPIALIYRASLNPDLMKPHYPSSAESPFH